MLCSLCHVFTLHTVHVLYVETCKTGHLCVNVYYSVYLLMLTAGLV